MVGMTQSTAEGIADSLTPSSNGTVWGPPAPGQTWQEYEDEVNQFYGPSTEQQPSSQNSYYPQYSTVEYGSNNQYSMTVPSPVSKINKNKEQVEQNDVDRKLDSWGFLRDVGNATAEENGDITDFADNVQRNADYLQYLKDSGYIDDWDPDPLSDLKSKTRKAANALLIPTEIGDPDYQFIYDPDAGGIVDRSENTNRRSQAKTESIDEAYARRKNEGELMVKPLTSLIWDDFLVEDPDDPTRVRVNTQGSNDLDTLFRSITAAGVNAVPAAYNWISNLRRTAANNNGEYYYNRENGEKVPLDQVLGDEFDKYAESLKTRDIYIPRDLGDSNTVNYDDAVKIATLDSRSKNGEPSELDSFWTGLEEAIGDRSTLVDRAVAAGAKNNDDLNRFISDLISDYIPGRYENGEYHLDNSDFSAPVENFIYPFFNDVDPFVNSNGTNLTVDEVYDLLDGNNITNKNSGPFNIFATGDTIQNESGDYDLLNMLTNTAPNTLDMALGTSPFLLPFGLDKVFMGGMLAPALMSGVDPFSYDLESETFDNPGSMNAAEYAGLVADIAANTVGEKLLGLGGGKGPWLDRLTVQPIENALQKIAPNNTGWLANTVRKVAAQSPGEGFEEVLQDIPSIIANHSGANPEYETDKNGELVLDSNGNPKNLYDSEGKLIYDDSTNYFDRVSNITPDVLFDFGAGLWLTPWLSFLPTAKAYREQENFNNAINNLASEQWVNSDNYAEASKRYNQRYNMNID